MKKLTIACLAGLMAFNFAACNKEAPKEEPKAEEAEAPKDYCSTVTVDSLKDLAKAEPTKDGKNKIITEDSYIEILNSLQCCKPDENTLVLDKKNCLTYDAIEQAKKATDAKFVPSMQQLMPKLIKHESPVVRAESYVSMSSIFGANKEHLAQAKEAIKNEKDPYALNALIKGLSNEGNKDADIGKFLIDMSKHEHKVIRQTAANALANPWSDKVEGVADAIIALMSDKEENVARAACKNAGRIGDEKVIEPIVNILNDDSKAKMHGDCVRGLAWMWLDYPQHKQHNENAYKATMDYLKKTPRTKDIPAWNAITAFNTVGNSKGEFDAWKSEATWFKLDDFNAVMTDLIKDENFNWIGKPPAMKAIASFGGKAELEKLKPVVDGLNDANVKKAFDEELAKAK